MTVAELIAELQAKDPEALVVIDTEHHGWWSLEAPNGLQDKWVVSNSGEFAPVDEGTKDAARAVRIW